MIWQLVALALAAVLVLAGLALIYPPVAFIAAGLLVGAAALLVDPDTFRKGGRP